MDREKKRRHEAGKVEVIEPVLEVLDDFERSIEAAEDLENNQDAEQAYESLKGGVEMVFRKFRDTLENLGVEPIEAEGTPFDEDLHEAMMRQPSEDADPGTVLQEIRKGYRMEDRVIRHSRVVVASEPSEEE
jgi:molecular chaperone GrpE